MDNHVNNILISNQEKKAFFKSISKASKILILGHYNPDPDCLASQITTAYILQTRYDKKIHISSDGIIPHQAYEYAHRLGVTIINKSPVKYDFKNFDLVIFVDQPRIARSNTQENTLRDLTPQKTIMIDHHEENIAESPRFSLRIIKELPSCAEIIFQLFKTEIESTSNDKRKILANLVIYGIIADSQIFALQTVSKQTFETILELSRLGADIQNQIWNFRSKSFEEENSITRLLSKIQVHKLGFTYTFINPEDLPENDESKVKVIDDFKFELTCISDFDIHIIFQEKHKKDTGFLYEIRLRSRHTNILPLGANLGCAGHQHSAGGRITAKDDEDVVQKVSSAYQKFMKSKNK